MPPGMLTIDDDRAQLPSQIYDHDGFRAWARSGDVPDGMLIAFVEGEVLIEMSPEASESHNKPKLEVTRVLAGIIRDRDLGEAFADRMLLSNVEAELSTEPDFLFASWEAFESGRVRLVEKANRVGEYVELEGTPDLVVEVLSDTSVRKDQNLLRRAYHHAGVAEYWLVDVRREVSFQILEHTENGYQPNAPDGQPQASAILGLVFELSRAKNRLGRWRYTLATRSLA